MMKSIHSILPFVLLVLTLNACQGQAKEGFKNIKQAEFTQKMNDANTLILDVRTPAEVAEGYISGADVFVDFNDPQFAEKMQALDKSKTYLVYCRSGARSSNASKWMVQNGFNEVYNLQGGILDWKGSVEK